MRGSRIQIPSGCSSRKLCITFIVTPLGGGALGKEAFELAVERFRKNSASFCTVTPPCYPALTSQRIKIPLSDGKHPLQNNDRHYRSWTSRPICRLPPPKNGMGCGTGFRHVGRLPAGGRGLAIPLG